MHGGLASSVVEDVSRTSSSLGCVEVWNAPWFRMCSSSGMHDDVQWLWKLSSLWFGIHGSLEFSVEMQCPNTLEEGCRALGPQWLQVPSAEPCSYQMINCLHRQEADQGQPCPHSAAPKLGRVPVQEDMCGARSPRSMGGGQGERWELGAVSGEGPEVLMVSDRAWLRL